jgi:hypothetical protein
VQEALFVDGVPAKLTVNDFRRYHLQSFPKLADSQYDQLIADAIDAVYAMFVGVLTIWNWQSAQIWYEKTMLAFRLLTAWYICDLYPELAAGGGAVSMGGIPLKRKKIYGIDITFPDITSGQNKDYLDLLSGLKSNVFGMKAYQMIKSAVKITLLKNRRVVGGAR